jgi:hypothetical protein
MPDKNVQSLPFLTRDMLAFEMGVALSLRIDMQSDTAIPLVLRGMTREGIFKFAATTAATSLITQSTFRIPDIPIYITVEDVNRTAVQGGTFITVSLLADGEVIQQLTSGYIYAQKALSWPNTSQVDLREGGGKFMTKVGTDPAAGVAADIEVPQGEVWKIQEVEVLLTTSATVATRQVSCVISQPDGSDISFWGTTTQTASLTKAYTIAPKGTMVSETLGNTIFIDMCKDLIVQPLGIITVDCTNRQAGDNFGALNVIIEKFFTTP